MSTTKESIDWYNNYSREYTKHVRTPDDSLFHYYYEKPAMYSALPDLKNKKVLSLGCGSGEDSHYLKSLGASESVGIDISSGMIKIAKESYSDCEFLVMDMEKLDFRDNYFDFIYSSLAIHYIEYWEKILGEAYRVLKPGGSFLFSCNHPVNFAFYEYENKGKIVKEFSITKGDEKNIIVGNYLSHKAYVAKDWPVTTWSKPIGEMSNEIFASGFLIRRVIEPKPTSKLKVVSEKNYEKLSKVPAFIIFDLTKILLKEKDGEKL